jgi:uncharacterized sulfatase
MKMDKKVSMNNLAHRIHGILALSFSMTLSTHAQLKSDKLENPLVDKKPNIIMIYTDDHGYSDLSCQGVFDDVKTPFIDALAEGGVLMKHGYSTAPQCVPSRAGLMTGQYQTKFGVDSNGQDLSGFDKTTTIGQRLQGAGYATGMAGKWHLGAANEIANHGFDWVFNRASPSGRANFTVEGEEQPFGLEKSGLYHIDACSAAMSAFISKFKDQPFFFYCAYRAPHVTLDPTQKYLDRFPGEMPERRRKALAMLSAVDDGVGNMMETLRKHNLEENTLIFVVSDNGAPLKITKADKPGGGPGWDGSLNDPMNGEKGMLSEGGIHVPFVVYWKGTIPAGQIYEHPVITLDMAATANKLAGLPDDPALDGVNLIPYLAGKDLSAPHEALFWRWSGQSAIRKGKWKYLQAADRRYLYNLEEDIEESTNLLNQHPEKARQLLAELEAWGTTLSPPGLHTSKISANANRYFDFYLDGKKKVRLSENRNDAEPSKRRKREHEYVSY